MAPSNWIWLDFGLAMKCICLVMVDMFGFLLQWPTLLTLAMFPVLVWMYLRLAKTEEREAIAAFGDAYRRYAARVPAFIPRSLQPVDMQNY